MDNPILSEQSQATRFGQWIDEMLSGSGSSSHHNENPGERGLVQDLISVQEDPSKALLMRIAAIPHRNEQTAVLRGLFGWSRRWAVATAAVLAILTVAAVPASRTAVAAIFGFDVENTPTTQISVPVPGSDGLSVITSAAPGLGDDFRMLLIELPFSGPTLDPTDFESLGFAPIEPGTQLEIGKDEVFEVPGGLPEHFEWRGIVRVVAGHPACGIGESCDGYLPSAGRMAWGDGKEYLTGNITPIHLVAIDNSGNLLVLSRFVVKPGVHASAKAFIAGGGRQFGMIFEPVKSDTPITFLIADDVEVIITAGVDAIAYAGMWDLAGDWNSDDGWNNLTWIGRDGIYHLSAQNVRTETLLNIAAEVGVFSTEAVE